MAMGQTGGTWLWLWRAHSAKCNGTSDDHHKIRRSAVNMIMSA